MAENYDFLGQIPPSRGSSVKISYQLFKNIRFNTPSMQLFRTIPSFMRIQDNPLPPTPPHPGYVHYSVFILVTFLYAM